MHELPITTEQEWIDAAGPVLANAAYDLWPIVEPLVTRAQAGQRLLIERGDQASRSWVLGDSTGAVASVLYGVAHDLSHPECEDSTVGHLAEWLTETRRALNGDDERTRADD